MVKVSLDQDLTHFVRAHVEQRYVAGSDCTTELPRHFPSCSRFPDRAAMPFLRRLERRAETGGGLGAFWPVVAP